MPDSVVRFWLWPLLFCILLLVGEGAVPAAAQQPSAPAATADTTTPAVSAVDRQVLLAVYRREGPVVTSAMRGVDAVAYPLFFGAAPAAWGAALLRGEDYDDAYRLTLSEALALAATLGLKKAFGRPRPYRTLPQVRSRSEQYRRGAEGRFAEAFPSGHATASFALAASWSLSHPRWYVVGPSLAGAALIATSRLWLGVHYPSDVLAGALLGTGAAVGVHLLSDVLTPGFLKAGEPSTSSAPMVHLRVRL